MISNRHAWFWAFTLAFGGFLAAWAREYGQAIFHADNLIDFPLIGLISGFVLGNLLNTKHSKQDSGIAALLSVTGTVVMAVLVRRYGFHSTPGIWSFLLGLPGTFAGGYVAFDSEYTGFAIATLVNWLFYWGVIAAVRHVIERCRQTPDATVNFR